MSVEFFAGVPPRPCSQCGSRYCSGHCAHWVVPMPPQPELDYEKLADMVAERILKELKEVKE